MDKERLTTEWPASFDKLYRQSDRLYYRLSRECGLSESAYWVMYAAHMDGGEISISKLTEEHNFLKQTVNSALRQLKQKGLIEVAFCEGSRKAKKAVFTEAGRAFAAERIQPAVAAERRAFSALTVDEQREMIRLANKYVEAVAGELDRFGKA
ncbi:MarR family transcriptional regulator [Paratractidigestivibacter sp.]|uniref:MarR family winged helix-turn-helix transcriptional regulator n=1 Tax=Paratractidigestivibacter sp. TaxID=2847316 RepID=UPI002AC8A776|nr:MarR family transcriptional regulator [Paratractidigestivibacter sp.]